MASGYEVAGIDLDSIFAPYSTGTKPPATGYDVGGVDLNQRYAPLSQGSAALATGYKVAGGADLNTLFAAVSTTSVTVATQPANVSGSSASGDPTGTVTSGTTTCAGANGTGTYSYTWHFSGTVPSGVSFTASSSATTAVKGTAVPANSTQSGSMYCTISDGVHSVNTNTVTWSLTNTTIPISVGLQPSNVTGSSAAGNPSGTVTSGSTTCAGANGTGSYTYTWHQASGPAITFTNPSSASTAVKATVNANSTISGTMYCTIKDATGATVNTSTVSWSLTNTSAAISITSYTVHGTATQPNNAGAAILFTPGGEEQYQTNQNAAVNIAPWDSAGNGSAYDFYVSLTSGPAPNTSGYTNTLNTWLTCSSTLGWSITNSAFDGSTVTTLLAVKVRLHSTGAVVASGSITLQATSFGTA